MVALVCCTGWRTQKARVTSGHARKLRGIARVKEIVGYVQVPASVSNWHSCGFACGTRLWQLGLVAGGLGTEPATFREWSTICTGGTQQIDDVSRTFAGESCIPGQLLREEARSICGEAFRVTLRTCGES